MLKLCLGPPCLAAVLGWLVTTESRPLTLGRFNGSKALPSHTLGPLSQQFSSEVLRQRQKLTDLNQLALIIVLSIGSALSFAIVSVILLHRWRCASSRALHNTPDTHTHTHTHTHTRARA